MPSSAGVNTSPGAYAPEGPYGPGRVAKGRRLGQTVWKYDTIKLRAHYYNTIHGRPPQADHHREANLRSSTRRARRCSNLRKEPMLQKDPVVQADSATPPHTLFRWVGLPRNCRRWGSPQSAGRKEPMLRKGPLAQAANFTPTPGTNGKSSLLRRGFALRPWCRRGRPTQGEPPSCRTGR